MVIETVFPAGYLVLETTDKETARPVHVDLWYPASPAAREIALNYRMGSRGLAAPDAPPVEERRAVVALSPGDFASATSYSWIAEGLARQGFIVAGASHRPRDCGAALDAVLSDPRFEATADGARIGAIGHAAGGATVIALAGAVFDEGAMSQYCRSADAQGDRSCAAWGESPASTQPEEDRNFQDERVRAVVAMDPSRGPGHDARSLSRVKVPVLIVGSVDNDFLPLAHHAGRYARLIPGASFTPLAHGEGHFVFLDECSGDKAVQGVAVCKDRNGVRRADVHARLLEKIGQFLQEHLS